MEENIISPEESTIQKIIIGNYVYESKLSVLWFGDDHIKLTKKENDLLHWLALNQNKLVSRTKIMESVWFKANYFNGRSMDVFLTKLRKYLKEDPNISIISNHANHIILKVKTTS